MAYEHEFSNFPSEKITLHKFKNIDESVASLIKNINTCRNNGDFAGASKLLADNKTTLDQYIVDAITFRTLEEEIYNTQVYTKNRHQIIFFEDDEPDGIDEDVWIGGE